MGAAMESDAPFDPCVSSDVAAYVRGLAGGGPPLVTRIHPSDEMYRYELATPKRSREVAAVLYFATGRQIFQAVEDVVRWRFGGFAGLSSMLDFASGFGRTTRFLLRALSPEKISVAEIDPEAVRFQEETFGVRGAVPGSDPESFRLEGPFDFILAISFFSHLPAVRFEGWLKRLRSRLAPGGILLFSVHGMDLLPGPDRASGIVFRPVSETTRLEGAEYGTSYVTPEFVHSVADRVTEREDRLLEFPFGLAGFQDLYALLKPPLPPVLDLKLARFPWGAVDGSAIRDGVASVEGWAVGDADERPPDVRLFVRDRVLASSPGEGPHGSRRRWSFSFPISAAAPDDVVRFEAESARGLSKILLAASLAPYLPAPPV